MPPKRAASSGSPEAEGDPSKAPKEVSKLPQDVLNAMQDILTHIYDFRNPDGHDPSKLFHRKVSKRVVPDYYDVIKEPVSLSTVKQKLQKKEYLTFQEFVRDLALLVHNAQVYNIPESGAYQDALVVKQQIQSQLDKLVKSKVATAEQASLPYLGEIPTADTAPVEEEEEEEEDEEDEDDEADEDLGDEVPKKRGRGRPRKSSIVRREPAVKKEKKDKDKDKEDDNEDQDGRKKRGRPPKVLTPLEGRVQAMLKALRKPKHGMGQALILNFEKVPDKQTMPDYFREIKEPIAYDIIRRKYKRKKYQSFDQFMRDINLMFDNAKQYNEDESDIYKDAVVLQREAHRLAEEVKAKPDAEFVGDEDKLPMPEGILHNGELFKTGDWVLIQNANDLSKPIPAQIYRTYQDLQGGKWVNVCWYYRPEQTVHRFDKHFLENEVVKTGQYRDHRIDEIIGRCFIMFITRYFKGRPAILSPETEVFVCESRYNEEKHTFNKIKTWASCLPDEVRDKDYAMEPFAATRRYKKYPSPIAYTLKDEQKETDELPKPEWGSETAPPKIGGVHRRPRDPRDSPPPEPTPPPPPTPPPAPIQRVPDPPQQPLSRISQTPQSQSLRTSSSSRNLYSASQTASDMLHGQSPAPLANIAARPFSTQQQSYQPTTPSANYQSSSASYLRPGTSQQGTNSTSVAGIPSNPYQRSDNYRGPPPIETYTLADHANSQIPYEIRSLFQTDEAGRVLFFTAPPVYLEDDKPQPLHIGSDEKPSNPGGAITNGGVETSEAGAAQIGHSARYLAEKKRRQAEIEAKRRDRETEKEAAKELKRKREVEEQRHTEAEAVRGKMRVLGDIAQYMAQEVKRDLPYLDAGKWDQEQQRTVARFEASRRKDIQQAKQMERIVVKRKKREGVRLVAPGAVFAELQA